MKDSRIRVERGRELAYTDIGAPEGRTACALMRSAG
jgi:hypothetical protein